MVKLTEKQISQIEYALKRNKRIEIIPIKDGVRIVEIKRETIK